MAFLAPLMMLGFAALAVPILLHLIQRERKRVVEFPSLMFLRRIPYQSVRRRRIQHWALLLMRLGAIALIVAAFARPFIRGSEAQLSAAGGPRDVVVLLDRSYSMGYGDRWQRAQTAAKDVFGGLGQGERATLVLFDTGAEVSLRAESDRGRLNAAVDAASVSAAATRFAPALKLAGSLLAESKRPRREVVLISDYQKAGWGRQEEVHLPEGTILTTVSVVDPKTANLSVTPVSIQRSRFEDQDRATVTAGVRNHSDGAVSGVPLALEVDGKTVQTEKINVAAHASASVTFAPMTVSSAHLRGVVRLPDDRLDPDNQFAFVVSPARPLRVILIERPGSDEGLYLSRALSIGEAPRIDLVRRTPDSFSDADASNAPVIVVDDVAIREAMARRLSAFVRAGGGLLAIAGPNAGWPDGTDILPPLGAEPVDHRTGPAARLGTLEYGHAVFDLFRAPRSGDFTVARFYEYRQLNPASARVLARFDDGGAALVERTAGRGRVLVWSSGMDLAWNDFALKPVFLPFLHTMVRYLAGYREPAPYLSVGQVFQAPPDEAQKRDRIVLSPDGARAPLPASHAFALREQGFYEVRGATAAGADEVVASNVDLRESDLSAMDPRELAAAVSRRPTSGLADLTPQDRAEARERSQRLWWYLLLAGVMLLGAETLVSNHIKRMRQA